MQKKCPSGHFFCLSFLHILKFIRTFAPKSTIMDQIVKLQIKHGHRHWTVYTEGEWEYETFEREYKPGDELGMFGFYAHRIIEISDEQIVLEFNNEKFILTHDKPLHLFTEIEGREWSDGCVYDGDDYSIELSWLKS